MLRKIAFIDRDGTILKEPSDFQIDSLEKMEFVPDVLFGLKQLIASGFELVLISNQDGLGTTSFPNEQFETVQNKMLGLLGSHGISFSDILICPHFESDQCSCRKPLLGLIPFSLNKSIDRSLSIFLGDRESDRLTAINLGIDFIQIDQNIGWSQVLNQYFDQSIQIERETKETSVKLEVGFGAGGREIHTGLGFFDHMLDTLFSYAGIGGKLIAHGDLHVDSHHLIEDVAICLGRALKGLRDRITLVQRYNLGIPMDDARSFCLLDIGGRFYYQSQFQFNYEIVANIPTEMFDHFFYTLAQKAEWTLHLKSQGDNSHHEVESLFKAVGKAISFAYAPADQLVSTKGVL